MTDLGKEAEEYATKQCSMYFTSKGLKYLNRHNGITEGYYEGAKNSNYAKQQVIKGKIEVLEEYAEIAHVRTKIKALKAELKQLETPKI